MVVLHGLTMAVVTETIYYRKLRAGVDGSLYLIGSFEFSCGFGNNITVQSNNGSKDIIIIKYKPDGTVDWHKTIGGINTDIAGDIAAAHFVE